MLGWSISIYTSKRSYPEGSIVNFPDLPDDKYLADNRVAYWSSLNINGLSALIPQELETNITVLNKSGYPCLYYLPFGLIRYRLSKVQSTKSFGSSDYLNREKIKQLSDQAPVFVEAWDQS